MPSGTTQQLRRRRARARGRSRWVQWLLSRRGLSGRVVRTGRRSALTRELGTLPRPAGGASASATRAPSLAPSAPRRPHVTGGRGEFDFSGPRELFSSLIRPLTEDEFFRNYWEREPLVIKRGCLATPHPYFSLADLHSLVARQPIRFGRHVNVCRYGNGRRRSYGEAGRRMGPGLLHRLWAEEKATIQLLQPQQFQDSLWHILSLLESFFGCLVGSNVYLTPSGSQGLAPHYDDVEVFILQLEGRKHWRLHPPSLPLPPHSSADLSEESIGPPSHDFVLEPGDLLYFPRGTIHHARTPLPTSPLATAHSTHITISTYQQNSWGDFLSSALSSAHSQLRMTDISFRRGLPHHLLQQPVLAVQCPEEEEGEEEGEGPHSQARRYLQRLGHHLLDWVASHHHSLLSNQRQEFLTSRLPPFCPPGPHGSIPDGESLVYLTWPDHMLMVTTREEGVVGGGGGGGAARRRSEVIVYHSLANERAQHMVVMATNGNLPQPRGVKFPLHFLPSLHLLSSSSPSSPLPSSSLPLPKEERHSLLLALWGEGLLVAQQPGP